MLVLYGGPVRLEPRVEGLHGLGQRRGVALLLRGGDEGQDRVQERH